MRWGPYKIHWEHSKGEIGKKTICLIADTSFVDPIVIASGSCTVHKRDHFCKNIGRKISLARALKKWQLSKDSRKEVWQAYYEMRGGKW